MDKFVEMWKQQERFMKLLQEKRNFPKFPVDIFSKPGQKFLKQITFECMGELFEANQHLRNGKDHRATDVPQLERDEYLEEIVDCLHYLWEIAIASGISSDELYEAYMKKGEKNEKRINEGY